MPTFERRTETVTLYPGGYLAEIRHLENQHQNLVDLIDDEEERNRRAAEDGALTGRTLDEEDPEDSLDQLRSDRDKLAAEHRALVAEAEEKAVHVTVQALPRRVWKTLTAEHPPRTVSNKVSKAQAEIERAVGVNEDTFKDALVAYQHPDRPEVRTIIEPQMDAAELDEFLDDLSDANFDEIYLNAFACNRARTEDPKASLGSRPTPASSGNSD